MLIVGPYEIQALLLIRAITEAPEVAVRPNERTSIHGLMVLVLLDGI